jgi:hypothetical protein
MLRRLLSVLSASKSRKRPPAHRALLSVEALENRELPALVGIDMGLVIGNVNTSTSAGMTATLQNGVLRVQGTDGADNISVRQDAGAISVVSTVDIGPFHQPGKYDIGMLSTWSASVPIQTATGTTDQVPASTVQRIEVFGLEGNDVIQLDQGSQPITVPALLDGGSGNDYLAAGTGPTTFRVGNNEADVVANFRDGDQLAFSQPTQVVKWQLRGGKVSSVVFLGKDNVLYQGGQALLSDVRDFAVARDNTLYALTRSGLLQSQSPTLGWGWQLRDFAVDSF